MAKVGAQRAAELTGKSKSTIQRSMNSGKLSFELDANNRRIIDVSELERVFGLEPQGGSGQDTGPGNVEVELKKAADLIEMERMKMRIRSLEEQLEVKDEMIDDLKAQRDQWQKQAQQVLITSQYSQQQAEELKAELKDRDERARAQRQKMMDERNRRMQQGQTSQVQRPAQPAQQQAKPAQPPSGATSASASDDAGNGIDFQGLWKKIKGDKAA